MVTAKYLLEPVEDPKRLHFLVSASFNLFHMCL